MLTSLVCCDRTGLLASLHGRLRVDAVASGAQAPGRPPTIRSETTAALSPLLPRPLVSLVSEYVAAWDWARARVAATWSSSAATSPPL
jgi:hypothetical protein